MCHHQIGRFLIACLLLIILSEILEAFDSPVCSSLIYTQACMFVYLNEFLIPISNNLSTQHDHDDCEVYGIGIESMEGTSILYQK